MARLLRLLACAACMAVLPAYAQQAPKAKDEPAVIFIFRKTGFQRSLFEIYINDQLIAKDFPGRAYFAIKTPPGELLLRTAGRPKYYIEEKTFRLRVDAGKTYYLEAVLDYDFMSGALYLVQRTEEDFRRRLKSLQLYEKAKTELD
jgi:hypothetical protein